MGDKKRELDNNNELQLIGDYIKKHEGFSAKSYPDIGSRQTIGYGHLLLPGENAKQMDLDKTFQKDLSKKIDTARKLFPKYDEYPIDTKKALVDGVFRGEFKAGHKTVDYINKSNWKKVPAEYINRDDYRESKEKGTGVYKRMDENSSFFQKMSSLLLPNAYAEEEQTQEPTVQHGQSIPEIQIFREKYPMYNHLDDAILADKLAKKYPQSYSGLPDKVATQDYKEKVEGGSKLLEAYTGIPAAYFDPENFKPTGDAWEDTKKLGTILLTGLNSFYEPIQRVYEHGLSKAANLVFQERKPVISSLWEATVPLRKFQLTPEERFLWSDVFHQYNKDLNKISGLPENYTHPYDRPMEIVGGLSARFLMPDFISMGKGAIKKAGKASMDGAINTLKRGKDATIKELDELTNYLEDASKDVNEWNNLVRYIKKIQPPRQARATLQGVKELRQHLKTYPAFTGPSAPAQSAAQRVIPGIQSEVSLPTKTVGQMIEEVSNSRIPKSPTATNPLFKTGSQVTDIAGGKGIIKSSTIDQELGVRIYTVDFGPKAPNAQLSEGLLKQSTEAYKLPAKFPEGTKASAGPMGKVKILERIPVGEGAFKSKIEFKAQKKKYTTELPEESLSAIPKPQEPTTHIESLEDAIISGMREYLKKPKGQKKAVKGTLRSQEDKVTPYPSEKSKVPTKGLRTQKKGIVEPQKPFPQLESAIQQQSGKLKGYTQTGKIPEISDYVPKQEYPGEKEGETYYGVYYKGNLVRFVNSNDEEEVAVVKETSSSPQGPVKVTLKDGTELSIPSEDLAVIPNISRPEFEPPPVIMPKQAPNAVSQLINQKKIDFKKVQEQIKKSIYHNKLGNLTIHDLARINRMSSNELVKEITQDVWSELIASDSYDSAQPFTHWLNKTIKGRVINQMLRYSVQPEFSQTKYAKEQINMVEEVEQELEETLGHPPTEMELRQGMIKEMSFRKLKAKLRRHPTEPELAELIAKTKLTKEQLRLMQAARKTKTVASVEEMMDLGIDPSAPKPTQKAKAPSPEKQLFGRGPIEFYSGIPIPSELTNLSNRVLIELKAFNNPNPAFVTDIFSAIHKWFGEGNKGALLGNWAMEDIIKQIPQEERRDLISKAIEDPTLITSLQPNERAVYEWVKNQYTILGAFAEQEKIISAFRENYVTHIYKDSEDKVSKALYPIGGKLGAKFRFAKRRHFPTFVSAEEAGLHPIYDISILYGNYVNQLYRTLANKKFIDTLKIMKNENGTPLLMRSDKAPGNYVTVHEPVFSRYMYVGATEESDIPLLVKVPIKADPRVAHILDGLIRPIFPYSEARGFIKRLLMWNPLFAGGNVLSDVLKENNMNIFKAATGLKRAHDWFKNHDARIEEMVRNGLNLSVVWDRWNEMHERLSGIEQTHGIGGVYNKIRDWNDKILWGWIVQNASISIYDIVKTRTQKIAPTLTEEQAGRIAARYTNDIMGSLPNHLFRLSKENYPLWYFLQEIGLLVTLVFLQGCLPLVLPVVLEEDFYHAC